MEDDALRLKVPLEHMVDGWKKLGYEEHCRHQHPAVGMMVYLNPPTQAVLDKVFERQLLEDLVNAHKGTPVGDEIAKMLEHLDAKDEADLNAHENNMQA